MGRAVSRPDLRERSPAALNEVTGGRLVLGNPELERAHITHADLALGPARLRRLGDLELVGFFFLRLGLLARANLLAAGRFLCFFLHGAIAGAGLVCVMNAHCDVSVVARKPQP